MKTRRLKPLIFCACFLLFACDTQPVKDSDTLLPEEDSYSQADAGELEKLAQQNLQRANETSGGDRERLLFNAARLFYRAGNYAAARNALAAMQAGPPINGNVQLLQAQIALAENNPEKAIALVPDLATLSGTQQLKAQALLADINAALGYTMTAIKIRVNLEPALKSEAEKRKNNEQIWAALSSMPTSTLNRESSSDGRVTAWLELARIMRGFMTRGQSSTDQVEQAVLDWGTRYPQHPVSNAFLSKLIDEYIATAQKVKTIAVLLPQQGKFATAADTIKNGLLSAYYADSHSINRPILRFYDTSDPDIAFSQLLQRALDEGATNVIGPLDKSLINKLAIEHALDAPVLTLNYGEHSVGQTDNLFQFGLAPEDEARQVAELAIRQGRKTAVILAPDSDWGRRLQTAFQQYFETLGGRVLSSQDYSNSTADFSRPIRRLLNLDQSAIRHRRIEDTLGERLQFIPYRRQDVDMIFIAATSRAARGIMPAFKFHHAADLPVYATSHVYTGTPNVQRDNDLNGLLFCDMPWVLENSSNGDSTAEDIQALKQTFLRNWPDQQRYTRLFALGVDAYHLVFNLEYLHENDFARFSGATGNIQLDENNRIVRSLLWAKFINGRAVYIEPEIKLDTRPDEAGPATLPVTTPASL